MAAPRFGGPRQRLLHALVLLCHIGSGSQAPVDSEPMLIVTPMMTQAANDREQIAPALAALKALPDCFHPERVLADTGRFSGSNVKACDAAKIEPLNAVGREGHPPAWHGRFEEPAPSPESATWIEQVRYTLKTCAGRATYALRKQTVEPVFGHPKNPRWVFDSCCCAACQTRATNGRWRACSGTSSASPNRTRNPPGGPETTGFLAEDRRSRSRSATPHLPSAPCRCTGA